MKYLKVEIDNILPDQRIDDIVLRQADGEYYSLLFDYSNAIYTRDLDPKRINTSHIIFPIAGVFDKAYHYVDEQYMDFTELLNETKNIEFIISDLSKSFVVKPVECPISVPVAQALFQVKTKDDSPSAVIDITSKSTLTEDFNEV